MQHSNIIWLKHCGFLEDCLPSKAALCAFEQKLARCRLPMTTTMKERRARFKALFLQTTQGDHHLLCTKACPMHSRKVISLNEDREADMYVFCPVKEVWHRACRLLDFQLQFINHSDFGPS